MNKFRHKVEKKFYDRSETIGNHGNMPPFYMHTQESKYKVIGEKHIEVKHFMKTTTPIRVS